MLKGSIVALVTPFHEDGSINFAKLEELLEWHIANGTDGILVLGTTGESTTMSHEEDDSVVYFTMKVVNHRVPVIAGSGSNDTQTQIDKSMKYDKMGVDALLCITPYYNKANQRGMIRHFTDVADKVEAPIILYNVPGRTGCSLSVKAVEELSEHPKICGIKEASGDISYAMNISHLIRDDFQMFSGNDDIIVPLMSLGASGVISVLANTNPRETHDLVAKWMEGDHAGSLAIQQKYLDYIHALFCEVNPIPVKEALNAMGMNVGPYRLPLYPMEDANRERLYREMRKVGLLS
ncbi:MAG: 4-hydroxy-tetrahydrodipicolinate synthase [Firmicutes bacterium]|nr:4-hydroxy-tetrahydrodipicolinate synthase [Bacillota bacterium]